MENLSASKQPQYVMVDGRLEIDYSRGVIYFIPTDDHPLRGCCLLRVYGVTFPIDRDKMIEVEAMPKLVLG